MLGAVNDAALGSSRGDSSLWHLLRETKDLPDTREAAHGKHPSGSTLGEQCPRKRNSTTQRPVCASWACGTQGGDWGLQ